MMDKNVVLAAACVAAACLAPAPSVRGQCDLVRLDPPGVLDLGGLYGGSVASEGSWIVVGQPGNTTHGAFSGAAYVFTRDAIFAQGAVQTIMPDGLSEGDNFGKTVAINGDLMAISAGGDDDGGMNSGAVYIFRFTGTSWIQTNKIVAPDPHDFEGFGGSSLAMGPDVVVVGAVGDADLGDHAGAVYVFRFNGIAWVPEAKLTALDGSFNDFFGKSVAIDDDVILVGAVELPNPSHRRGAAYFFRRVSGQWVQTDKVRPSSDGIGTSELFGISVALDGEQSLIGQSAARDAQGFPSGRAYIFEHVVARDQWIQRAILAGADGERLNAFGFSVALDENIAFVGAPEDDQLDTDAGAVHIFRRQGEQWAQTDKVLPCAAADPSFGQFGLSVAFARDALAIGAPREASIGAAYVLDTACPADIDGDGDADVADFFAFVVAFAAGDPTADINGDGSIDVGDFFAFVAAFAAGCP